MNDILDTLLSEPRLAAYSDSKRMKIGRLVCLARRCAVNRRLQMRLLTLLHNLKIGPLAWKALCADLVADQVLVVQPTPDTLIDLTLPCWLLPEAMPPAEPAPRADTDYSTPRVQRFRAGRKNALQTRRQTPATPEQARLETSKETPVETPLETVGETHKETVGETVHETPSDLNQIRSDLDLDLIRSDLDCLYIQTESDLNQIRSDPDLMAFPLAKKAFPPGQLAHLAQVARSAPEQWTEAEIAESLRRMQVAYAKTPIEKPVGYLHQTLKSLRESKTQYALYPPPPIPPIPQPGNINVQRSASRQTG